MGMGRDGTVRPALLLLLLLLLLLSFSLTSHVCGRGCSVLWRAWWVGGGWLGCGMCMWDVGCGMGGVGWEMGDGR